MVLAWPTKEKFSSVNNANSGESNVWSIFIWFLYVCRVGRLTVLEIQTFFYFVSPILDLKMSSFANKNWKAILVCEFIKSNTFLEVDKIFKYEKLNINLRFLHPGVLAMSWLFPVHRSKTI